MVSDRSTEPKSAGNKGRGALIKHVQNIPIKWFLLYDFRQDGIHGCMEMMPPPLRCIAALNILWDTPAPHLLIAVCTAFDRTKTREAS